MLTVRRNDQLSRYEARSDGELVSVIDYHRSGDGILTITHTGTDPAWRGRGFAGQLTEQALADIRTHGWRVRPGCPFTTEYLDGHPEHDDLRV